MPTTAENNVERMHQLCKLVQQDKRMDLFDEYFHEDFQDHPLEGGTTDCETTREFMKELHAAVDDFEVEIVDCVGQADVVATHKIFRGWLNTDFLGLAAGQKLNLRVMDFMRMRDGRAIEHWATHNPVESGDAQ